MHMGCDAQAVFLRDTGAGEPNVLPSASSPSQGEGDFSRFNIKDWLVWFYQMNWKYDDVCLCQYVLIGHILISSDLGLSILF